MRASKLFLTWFVWTGIGGVIAFSQSPAAPKKGTPSSQPQVAANLIQLMRGTLFPASNVYFAAQNTDPAKVPPAKDPSVATDPLANTYGQWQAVENAALAMVETANLLTIPGRKCANGLPVPIQSVDWPKFVQGLRDVGLKAYQAAQSKDQDKVTEAAGDLSEACANCHNKYREKPTMADRCK